MIGIVILNYNSWNLTDMCVESILESKTSDSSIVYLIDNGSTEDMNIKTKELLNNKQVFLIRNKKNKGFAAGNNIGFKKALKDGCDNILIANNDIYFKNNSIELMNKYLKDNPEAGIVGPEILSPDGTKNNSIMFMKTGIKEKYLIRTFLVKINRKLRNKYYGLGEKFSKPTAVYAVSGCCFMISKKCAKMITPFDENTFLYEEELIIGIRMENSGYKTIFLPQSSVKHFSGQSSKKTKAFCFSEFVIIELYYCNKYLHSSMLAILPLYIIRTLGFLYRSLRYKDFRDNLFNYFKRTIPKIKHSI
jgi:GT2 family glycosyltransferase